MEEALSRDDAVLLFHMIMPAITSNTEQIACVELETLAGLALQSHSKDVELN
jgi:hypothetical protein